MYANPTVSIYKVARSGPPRNPKSDSDARIGSIRTLIIIIGFFGLANRIVFLPARDRRASEYGTCAWILVDKGRRLQVREVMGSRVAKC